MKFIWEDGFIIEKPVGYKIVGLKHKSLRPLKIDLTDEETKYFEIHKEYASHVLKAIRKHPCLLCVMENVTTNVK